MTDLLTDVCRLPTAPFREGRVLDYIDRFAAARPGVRIAKDRHGNRLLQVGGGRGAAGRAPRLIFVAHTDHPGFVAGQMIGKRTLQARFRGGVPAEYVNGAKVRFFPDEGEEIVGRVRSADADDRGRATDVIVRVRAAVPAGSAGMFDLPAGRIRGKRRPRVVGRCCDDLAGVAAVLATIDRLAADPPPHAVGALLTRAEEDGFVGALAAVHDGKLLRPTDRLVSVECSAAQEAAPIGGGVVVRVGDATSVFDSALTYFLSSRAKALADADDSFRWRRALMPGGTCEATVFGAWGHAAAAACVPLGNYHNVDRDRGRIGPEHIDLGDWRHMVELFVRCAADAGGADAELAAMKERLSKRFDELKRLL